MTAEAARDKLHQCIKLYDLSDIRTLEASQELDKLIVEEMKEEKDDKDL